MVQYLSDNENYVYALEDLLKKLRDPGEEFESGPVLKVDDFVQIYSTTVENHCQTLLAGNKITQSQLTKSCKVLDTISYFILDKLTLLYKTCESQMTEGGAEELLDQYLDVYSAVMPHLNSSVQETEKPVLKVVLDSIGSQSAASQSKLKFLSLMVNRLGISSFIEEANKVSPNIGSLLAGFVEKTESAAEPAEVIALLSLVRKLTASELV